MDEEVKVEANEVTGTDPALGSVSSETVTSTPVPESVEVSQ